MTARERDDAGVMMIELVVVMTILSIVTAIATTGIVGVLRQQRAAVAYTDAQGQAGRAVQKLDAELRYAGDMTVLSGATARPELPDPSLVWVAVDPTSTTAGLRCVALSLKNNALQRREWAARPAAVAVAQVTPSTLAAGVQAVTGQQPFVVSGGLTTVTGDGEPVQVSKALTAELHVQVVAPNVATGRVLQQQFVALNSRQGTYAVATQCF